MIDDNILMCKKINSEKCIADELYRNKKYMTYLLFILEAYNEDENRMNETQLFIVTIKFAFLLFWSSWSPA